MPFTCTICEEESTRICVQCTKDTCSNHLCDKCGCCSDCCGCEVPLDDIMHAETVHPEPVFHAVAEPVAGPPAGPTAAIAVDPMSLDPNEVAGVQPVGEAVEQITAPAVEPTEATGVEPAAVAMEPPATAAAEPIGATAVEPMAGPLPEPDPEPEPPHPPPDPDPIPNDEPGPEPGPVVHGT